MREYITTIFPPPVDTTLASPVREPQPSRIAAWLRSLWPSPETWRKVWNLTRSVLGVALACVLFTLAVKHYGTIAQAMGVTSGIEGPPDLFSSFAAGLVRFSVAAVGFVSLHTFMLRRIKTDEAIADKNIAYGLFLVALAIVIHAAIAGS